MKLFALLIILAFAPTIPVEPPILHPPKCKSRIVRGAGDVLLVETSLEIIP